MKYVLLYQDENQISYFYNLEDKQIYSNKEKLQTEKITKFSKLGGAFGIIMYNTLGSISAYYLGGISTTIYAIIMALILAVIITHILINKTKNFFIEKNKLPTSYEKVNELAINGEKHYKNYNKIMIILFIFTIVGTGVLLSSQSILVFISKFLLWFISFLMYFLKRPIYYKKFKKALKKGYLLSLK